MKCMYLHNGNYKFKPFHGWSVVINIYLLGGAFTCLCQLLLEGVTAVKLYLNL